MARYVYSESDSEFTETDESIVDYPRRKVVYRRRSISRRRASPDYSNTYLSPGVQLHRSVSTGPRRRRDEPPPPPPALIVDINNDVRSRNKSKTRLSRKDMLEVDSEEEVRERDRSRRPRARTMSRMPSPAGRDWELMVDQRILAKNDARQDLELNRLEQEIARLEREVARRTAEVRLLRPGEDRYEEETSRIKKLEKWEKKLEEARREAEWRDKLKRHEEKEESRREAELREKLEKLKRHEEKEESRRETELREELKKYKEKEAARREAEWRDKLKKYEERDAAEAEKERIIKELRDEEARRLLEQQERDKERAKLKAEAIEEYKKREKERIEREQKEKEEKEKYFRERLKELGYVEEQIDSLIIGKDSNGRKEKEKEKETKTTWVKVHRRYLLPETLDAFNLPWEWDRTDRNYIVIKEYISDEVQEELFAHTERLRGRKLIEQTSSSQVELKLPEKSNKDKMYLVRKKSPRRSWIFT